MTRTNRHLLSLLLLLPLLARAAPEPALTVLVYPNPGLFDVGAEGRIEGAGAELLARLSAASGVPHDTRAVPAARAQAMVVQLPLHCIFGVSRTAEREPLFSWVGPLASGELVLFGRPGELRQVNGPQDLAGRVVVAQRHSQALAWLVAHGVTVHEANDLATGLRMLRAGRVDYWLANELAARPVIRRLGGEPLQPLLRAGRVDLYVACHRELPAALRERLQAGVAQLRRDGELAPFGLR